MAATYRVPAWWRVLVAAGTLSLVAAAGTPTPGGATSAFQAAPGSLVIRFLDVGDGDATWLTMPDGRTMLVDCGSVGYSRQLVLQLQAAGVEHISLLALTNARANVVGGCADLIRYVSVDQLVWSGQRADTTAWRAFESLTTTYRVPLLRGDAAQEPIDWGGGAIIRTLNPPSGVAGAGLDEYDGSLVLLLEYAGWRVLFAGAIHQTGERQALDAGLRGSAVHVLKVADHGSAAGTSDSFLGGIFGAGTSRYLAWQS